MHKSLMPLIPEIMERFNFDSVRRTMELLNWTWAGVGTPTVDQLRAEAQRLLEGCVERFEQRGCPQSGMSFACGGFQAMVHCYQDPKARPELQLVFYVDSAAKHHWD